MEHVFFGYPWQPRTLSETLARAAGKISATGLVTTKTWEDLSVSGKVIIDVIAKEIRQASLSVFDVTDLNQNVLFELGYAIGSNRKVWLVRDDSRSDSNKQFRQLRILTTVGYLAYTNSDQIRAGFLRDKPHEAPQTIFESSIQPNLEPSGLQSIFFVKGPYDTDAQRFLEPRVRAEEEHGIRCFVHDSAESAVQPLVWYAKQIYASAAVIVHFSAESREKAGIHNARNALIAGLAHGLGRPLLLLAEDDYFAPIDFRDLLFIYATAQQCLAHADSWLSSVLVQAHARASQSRSETARTNLAAELKSLRLGEPIAENEELELAEYFIESASYHEVLAKKSIVFVGRKGVGKTANLFRATETLSKDKRNLVCVIKPPGYELEGVVKLIRQYPERHVKSFLIENLWKFLLYSEIALTVTRLLQHRTRDTLSLQEIGIVDFVCDKSNGIDSDFAVRLERAVDRLARIQLTNKVEGDREQIVEALHKDVLGKLRRLLGDVLTTRNRVAVLVDNLDKPWDKSSELEELSQLLLGLLNSIKRVELDLAKADVHRKPVPVTLAIFLRSDIFAHVARIAPEPDKLPVTVMKWTDRAMLLRVVEERYVAGRIGAPAHELWDRWFVRQVKGRATKDYIVSRVLPRPRDILVFCNAAIFSAINRGHARVELDDIDEAEKQYSQFATEAVLVENGISISELERVLFEFAGESAIIDEQRVLDLIEKAGIQKEKGAGVVQQLQMLCFLGIETKQDEYDYDAADEPGQRTRNAVLARRLAGERGTAARYSVHPAFRAYLEIADV